MQKQLAPTTQAVSLQWTAERSGGTHVLGSPVEAHRYGEGEGEGVGEGVGVGEGGGAKRAGHSATAIG